MNKYRIIFEFECKRELDFDDRKEIEARFFTQLAYSTGDVNTTNIKWAKKKMDL